MAMTWFKPSRNWGQLVLGVWLIATGIMTLFPDIRFEHSGTVLAVGALVAGILLVLGR
jgi:hypothetical protein